QDRGSCHARLARSKRGANDGAGRRRPRARRAARSVARLEHPRGDLFHPRFDSFGIQARRADNAGRMGVPTYDLAVIGSGPAGQKGAIAAAKLGKRVAVIDTRAMLGGVTLHGGTLPSKTLREAILYLTGLRQRAFYGREYRLKEDITVADLRARVQTVVEREVAVVADQLV